MTDTLSYSDFADEVARLYVPKDAQYTLEGLLVYVKGTLADNAALRRLVELERVEEIDLDATLEGEKP